MLDRPKKRSAIGGNLAAWKSCHAVTVAGRVAPHPYQPGWTHLFDKAALRQRGWNVCGSGVLPLGVFKTKRDANRHARSLRSFSVQAAP